MIILFKSLNLAFGCSRYRRPDQCDSIPRSNPPASLTSDPSKMFRACSGGRLPKLEGKSANNVELFVTPWWGLDLWRGTWTSGGIQNKRRSTQSLSMPKLRCPMIRGLYVSACMNETRGARGAANVESPHACLETFASPLGTPDRLSWPPSLRPSKQICQSLRNTICAGF